MSAEVSVYELPSWLPVPVPSYSCTVSPAAAPVPLRLTRTVRLVSLVRAPLDSVPVDGATSSVTEVMVGAPGAAVSMEDVAELARLRRAHPELRADRYLKGTHRAGRSLRIALALNATFLVVEVLGGLAFHSLALLADPSEEERRALQAIRYAPNHVTLHTDPAVLPRRVWAQAAWNYQYRAAPGTDLTLTMSYDLNRLQRLPQTTQYCVSVNPHDRVVELLRAAGRIA